MSAAPPETDHHDVVIVGAGNAGISLAARLKRDGARDIALIDARRIHRYRPLLSYVGGGQAPARITTRRQSVLLPAGSHWYPESAVAVDPAARAVHTDTGRMVTGTDLVLCPGIEPDWDAVPGSREAVFAPNGSSNYVDERAEHTWELMGSLRSGRAVFAFGDGPIPCAGAGLKPMFLAADHWRRIGVLDRIEVTLLVPWRSIWGAERVDAELTRAAREYGIEVRTGVRLRSIRDGVIEVHGADGADGAQSVPYDALHLVPAHRAPDWLKPAADDASGGMVAIDPRTLAHRHHRGVWGLGDAADVRTSRSGGALRKQVPVVAANIARARRGRELLTYDGYTVAPITTSRRALSVVEVDRIGQAAPSFPFVDLMRPSVLWWAYDRFVQPQLYWHSILTGRVRA